MSSYVGGGASLPNACTYACTAEAIQRVVLAS